MLDASSYDGALANTYSLTVGQDTVAGTFGDSVHEEIPVPQDGAVYAWSYSVAAADGSYQFSDSGQVGPCGTPPVVDDCPELPGDQPVGTECTPPPADVASTSTTDLDCDAKEQLTTTTTTTTPYVFDQNTQSWVPGTPVVTTAVTSEQVQPGDCAQPPVQPPVEPPVDECEYIDGVQTEPCDVSATNSTNYTAAPPKAEFTSSPTVLPAAGAPSVSSDQQTVSQLIGAAALTGGILLLAGLGLLKRRTLAAA